MDVGGWLRGLGLGQYEALFRASDIDADILPELTEVDLEKLGVSLGHRKRLLRAISGLAGGGSPLPHPAPRAAEGGVGVEAERRQLTVMFCDLVGSTPLSTRYDRFAGAVPSQPLRVRPLSGTAQSFAQDSVTSA